MIKKCIACGSASIIDKFKHVADYEYGTYHPVNFSECSQCRLLLQDPLPDVSQIQAFYPSEYRNHKQFGSNMYSLLKQRELTRLAKRIFTFIPKDKKILEIGCGGGLLLLTMKTLGSNKLYGTDISNSSQRALERNGVHFKKANIDIAFPYFEHFDLIILNQVIEHLRNPVDVLKRCKEHLNKNGKIVILTPNSDAIVNRMVGKYADGINAPRHFYIFSPRSFEYIKTKLKFRTLEFYSVLDPMQWAISCQNIFQQSRIIRVKLHRGLAWYTIFLGILLYPLTLTSLFRKKSASMMCVLS